MMRFSTRLVVVLAVVAAMLLLVFMWAPWLSKGGGAVANVDPDQQAEADAGSVYSSDPTSQHLVREREEPKPVIAELRVIGSVLDASTRTPLPAMVRSPSSGVHADRMTGSFRIQVPAGPASEINLLISHPGFRDHTVPLDHSTAKIDLGEIELLPAQDIQFLVLDAFDAPVSGASVLLSRTNDGRHAMRSSELQLGLTGDGGRLVVPLGSRERVFASHASAVSEAVGVDPPRSQQEVILRLGPAVTLGFRDKYRKTPYQGITAVARRLGAFPSVERLLRSDESGLCSNALLTPGVWEVRIDSVVSGLFFPGNSSPPVLPHSTGQEFVVDLPPQKGGVQWIEFKEVPPPTRQIRLLDAETGQALTSVRLWRGTTMSLPGMDSGWKTMDPERSFNLHDGLLDLRMRIWGQSIQQIERLILAPRGYISRAIDSPFTTLAADTPGVLAFERSSSRRVRLRDENGRPVLGRFRLVEDRSRFFPGTELWAGRADSGGQLGPAEWSGGPWAVMAELGKEVATIPREDLRDQEEIVLTIPSSGNIVVPVPPDLAQLPDLVCGTRDGYVFHLSNGTLVDSEIRFEGLRPGRYHVGPRALVKSLSGDMLQLRPQALADMSATVRSGETVEIPWNRRWSLEGPIECRVDAIGIPLSELSMVPWYAPEASSPPRGRYARRYPIEEDGRCVLRDLTARPARLVVVTNDDAGSAVPLAVTRPGGTARVRCGTLEIEITGSDSPFRVTYKTGLPGIEFLWLGYAYGRGGRVIVTGIPDTTEWFSVAAGRESKQFDQEIVAGQSRKVTIELDVVVK